jgi:DNA-binding response OmpR family regulator
MTILLIEDNPDIRENTEELLELAGYDVITAENGKIGIKEAKENLPDLILCDIMMPVMDGYDVIYYLSIDSKTSCIPFIFLTAKSEKTDFRKGMELGADDYLTKPFEEVELIKAIERRLNKSKQIKELFQNSNGNKTTNFNLNKEEDIASVFGDTKTKKYPVKSFVYLQHGAPIYLYRIKHGKVKTFKTNKDGKEFITGLYSDGDFFGYHSLLKEDEYSDIAMAMKDSEIELITKEVFLDIIKNKREIATEFIKLLSSNVIEKEEELLSLAYSSVKKRVAESLLKFFSQYKEENGTLGMIIPREDLANLAGTSTESAIRTLSEFKQDGLITIDGKQIYLKNKKELEDYKF